MTNKHFRLEISGTTHNSDMSAVVLEKEGCDSCLKTAITMLIVHDDKFRKLLNECGRAANEIRNGNKGPDPINN